MKRKRETRYPDNEYFTYYNANSHNHLSSDCVVRAICTVMEDSWETTLKELYNIGSKYGFVPTDDHVIVRYLKASNFIKYKEPRDIYNKKITVREFLRLHPDITAIANVGSHHMVAIVAGKVLDTWDSSNQIMHSYWVHYGAHKADYAIID